MPDRDEIMGRCIADLKNLGHEDLDVTLLDRLVEGHGVPRAQLEADGVGYLAPIASNLSEAGRQANRRVEAVLLTTQ